MAPDLWARYSEYASRGTFGNKALNESRSVTAVISEIEFIDDPSKYAWKLGPSKQVSIRSPNILSARR
jgi:hypothetical protein